MYVVIPTTGLDAFGLDVRLDRPVISDGIMGQAHASLMVGTASGA